MSSTQSGPQQFCKICGAAAHYLGELDANKCCHDRFGTRMLPVSSIKIPYLGCSNCGLIFTTYMDNWTAEDFKKNIYNDDYNRINPAFLGNETGPLTQTASYQAGSFIASMFDGGQSEIRFLDFGSGGNPGPTGQAIMDAGFQVHSYDPYRADATQLEGRYEVIIAIEVLEHCHDLASVAEFFKKHVARDGLIWVQTQLQPLPTPKDILESWYIAPRDGHVSIHTVWSLTLLFNAIGMNFIQTARAMFAFRNLPKFPNKLIF